MGVTYEYVGYFGKCDRCGNEDELVWMIAELTAFCKLACKGLYYHD